MTVDEVRALARSVAEELRARNVQGSPIAVSTTIRQERRTGLFGRKTEVSWRTVDRVKAHGWWLCRQPRRSETFQGGNKTEASHLWLNSPGELLAADVEERFDSLTGEETSQVMSLRAATDSDLLLPCHRWESVDLPPESRSRSSLWQERVWGRGDALGAPYEETARLIRALASR